MADAPAPISDQSSVEIVDFLLLDYLYGLTSLGNLVAVRASDHVATISKEFIGYGNPKLVIRKIFDFVSPLVNNLRGRSIPKAPKTRYDWLFGGQK